MDQTNKILFEDSGLIYRLELDNLIHIADTVITKTISRASVIPELFSTTLLDASLKEHTRALNKSAKASEKHGKSLAYATWVLV